MAGVTETAAVTVEDAANAASRHTAPSGLRYALFGDLSDGITPTLTAEIDRLTATVPALVAPALAKTIFYFAPLVLPSEPAEGEPRTFTVAPAFTPELGDRATCHRNYKFPDHDAVFLSSRLHGDRFALAFEFFINVAHGFIDVAGVPADFSTLVLQQAAADVRGETSHDAWQNREQMKTKNDEAVRSLYVENTFVDTLAIYMLSLHLDFDYADLREREYPLLAPTALADRLRLVARLLPPNPGNEFVIRFRRR